MLDVLHRVLFGSHVRLTIRRSVFGPAAGRLAVFAIAFAHIGSVCLSLTPSLLHSGSRIPCSFAHCSQARQFSGGGSYLFPFQFAFYCLFHPGRRNGSWPYVSSTTP
jgi:hypothetical protein